ncbi:MAG: hypothetical protein RLY14_1329 [Planctomycetota bacterium]
MADTCIASDWIDADIEKGFTRKSFFTEKLLGGLRQPISHDGRTTGGLRLRVGFAMSEATAGQGCPHRMSGLSSIKTDPPEGVVTYP